MLLFFSFIIPIACEFARSQRLLSFIWALPASQPANDGGSLFVILCRKRSFKKSSFKVPAFLFLHFLLKTDSEGEKYIGIFYALNVSLLL